MYVMRRMITRPSHSNQTKSNPIHSSAGRRDAPPVEPSAPRAFGCSRLQSGCSRCASIPTQFLACLRVFIYSKCDGRRLLMYPRPERQMRTLTVAVAAALLYSNDLPTNRRQPVDGCDTVHIVSLVSSVTYVDDTADTNIRFGHRLWSNESERSMVYHGVIHV